MCLVSLETNTSFNTMLWSKWLRYHIDHTPAAVSWLSKWNWAVEASTLKYLWRKCMYVTSPAQHSYLSSMEPPNEEMGAENIFVRNDSQQHLPQPPSSPTEQCRRGCSDVTMTGQNRIQIQLREHHRSNFFRSPGSNLALRPNEPLSLSSPFCYKYKSHRC